MRDFKSALCVQYQLVVSPPRLHKVRAESLPRATSRQGKETKIIVANADAVVATHFVALWVETLDLDGCGIAV